MRDNDITLYSVWVQQLRYNEMIKNRKREDDIDWMTDYILGTVSELGELLREMSWKKHRIPNSKGFGPNISEELADITKYVFSMWQLTGYSPQDMLRIMYRKGQILDQLSQQELRNPRVGQKIIMLDLDGVVADFRAGFSDWLQSSHWSDKLDLAELEFGLHLDLNNGWEYSVYEEAKLEFERLGGYASLPIIEEVLPAIQKLHENGFVVLVWTARPNNVYKRIRFDTWSWLQDHKIPADGLYFGGDERVQAAATLLRDNVVIAFEDNPTLAKRYAINGIPVILVTQPYNGDIPSSSRIRRMEKEEWKNDLVNLAEDLSNYAGGWINDRQKQ